MFGGAAGPSSQGGGLPRFGGGGILGGLGSAGSWLGHGLKDIGGFLAHLSPGEIGGWFRDVAGGVAGAVKFAAEFAVNPGGAISGLLDHVIGTKATGDLGSIGASGGSLPGGSSGAVGNLPANWKAIATFLSAHGFTRFASAGVAGNVLAESGGNPEILQAGGGGGGGLIQWTPYPGGYITGNYQRDLITQLNAILSWGGGPSLVNRATSPSNAAAIYQDYYERPANLTASLPVRMAGANAVYQAMGWGKFDNGGWLMPGMSNLTRKPEAVLTPEESAAFVAIAKHLTQQGMPGAGQQPVINLQYFGPQHPTPEMKAMQMRDLALVLGGASPA
jgi:hypothetical protein